MMKFLLPFALLLLTSVEGNLRGDLDKRLLKKGMRKSKKKDNMTKLIKGKDKGSSKGSKKCKEDCYSVQEGTPSTQVGREYTITVPTVTVPGASTTLPIKAEAGTETTPPTSASLSPTSSPPASDDAENAFTSTSSNGRGVVPAAVVPTNFHNWEQP